MNELHLQPAEKLAHYSGKTSRTVIDVEQAIKDLHETAKDKRVETMGFSGVVKASKRQTEVLNKIQEGIESPKKVVQKLDEVKSAALVTNQKLDKLYKKEAPTRMKVEIEGAELITIKGPKGEKGEKGDKGEKGEHGAQGERGLEGQEGKKGAKGEKGEEGKIGPKGLDGRHGKDGEDGLPANKTEIIKEVLKRIPEHVGDVMNQRGYSTGGANQITVKNNGTRVTDFYTELDFTTGLTLTYSNGKITVTSSGGSGFQLPLTGSVNGSNKTFTWATAPNALVVDNGNNMRAVSTDSTVNWTGTTTTVLTIAPNSDIYAIA